MVFLAHGGGNGLRWAFAGFVKIIELFLLCVKKRLKSDLYIGVGF